MQTVQLKFSSVEWWSIFFPTGGAAFLPSVLPSPGPPSGCAAFLTLLWVVLVPRKKSTRFHGAGRKAPLPKRRREGSGTTKRETQRRGRKATPPKAGGAPPKRRGALPSSLRPFPPSSSYPSFVREGVLLEREWVVWLCGNLPMCSLCLGGVIWIPSRTSAERLSHLISFLLFFVLSFTFLHPTTPCFCP